MVLTAKVMFRFAENHWFTSEAVLWIGAAILWTSEAVLWTSAAVLWTGTAVPWIISL